MPSDPLSHEAEVLEELIRIRGRQAELQACCERAEAGKNDVSPLVFDRVMSDYRERLLALDAEAMPLKLQAREAYVALQASFANVHEANEQAAADREELLFRHKVGEFAKDVLDGRIKEPEQRLSECADALAALDLRRARFLEAFGGPESLELFMDEAPAPAPAPAPPPLPATAATPVVQAPAPAAPPEPAPPPSPEPVTRAMVVPEPEPPAASESDRTRMVPIEALEVPPETPRAPAGAESSDTGEARTMILPAAVLVVRLKGEPDREYAISPLTSIGRSDHNSVCIPRRNVSREHAAIQAAQDGFILKDLGSQNGTVVNGDAVTECVLRDGDVIVIGDAQIDVRMTSAFAR